MNSITIDTRLEELLDLLYYMARDKKCRSIILSHHYVVVTADINRLMKMFKAGKELRPASYKKLTVLHKRHGSDHWEVRLSAGKITVILNKNNWDQFELWVNKYMGSSPGSAAGLMAKYPHVRLGNIYED